MKVKIKINDSTYEVEVRNVKKLLSFAVHTKVLDQLAGKYRRVAEVPRDEVAKAVATVRTLV